MTRSIQKEFKPSIQCAVDCIANRGGWCEARALRIDDSGKCRTKDELESARAFLKNAGAKGGGL